MIWASLNEIPACILVLQIDLEPRSREARFGSDHSLDRFGQLAREGLQPWAVMAFNNLVMSYVTMAPMYSDLLGQDPFSEQALENQLTLVRTLLLAVFEYRGE